MTYTTQIDSRRMAVENAVRDLEQGDAVTVAVRCEDAPSEPLHGEVVTFYTDAKFAFEDDSGNAWVVTNDRVRRLDGSQEARFVYVDLEAADAVLVREFKGDTEEYDYEAWEDEGGRKREFRRLERHTRLGYEDDCPPGYEADLAEIHEADAAIASVSVPHWFAKKDDAWKRQFDRWDRSAGIMLVEDYSDGAWKLAAKNTDYGWVPLSTPVFIPKSVADVRYVRLE